LATSIENEVGLFSRFVVLGHRVPAATGKDKTTFLCSVKERAGALSDVLAPIAERGLSMTKIESKTLSNRAMEHVFYIDVLGHVEDKDIQHVLSALAERSVEVKILGSYPVGLS
jgi:chorismate mutase/prephenate dehydratase